MLLASTLVLSVAACAPSDAPRSVILIVVDTLRADHLGTYGYRRRTSPNLDDWAQQGQVFEQAISTAPWTLPTFGSLYTGYLPLRHRAGMAHFDPGTSLAANRLRPDVIQIAQQLAGSGLNTGAVVNNPFLSPTFGLNRGFEVYDHVPGNNRKIRRADVTVTQALDLIDSWNGAPFFLVVHLFDPHLSYDPPAPFRGTFTKAYDSQLALPFEDLHLLRDEPERLTDTDWDFVRAAYDEEILFVDEQLGRLRAGLAARDVLDSTLIILTADHGEEFHDHGGFEHGHALWQEIIRVPLVFWGPGVEPGRETQAVSLADVTPTILDSMGVSVRKDLDGRSLWDHLNGETPLGDRTLYEEGLLYGDPRTAILRWPLKLVVDQRLVPVRVLDLHVDPSEQTDLSAAWPEGATVLLEQLRARARESLLPGLAPDIDEADPGTLERLRSLGYIR